MERRIGEIFEHNGEWYQCIKGVDCVKCDLRNIICRRDTSIFPFKECSRNYRTDDKSVIFKKLEKVGEPYEHYGKLYQCYKLPVEIEIRLLPDNCYPVGKDNLVEIEIKQTKEDMEEKKVQHYDCFFDREPSKSNLKPFDLEAAKAGKPVCTRDGRKARIICFDVKGDKPIIALIEYEIDERPCNYFVNGRFYSNPNENNDADLMMLPEKKEGWINIYEDMVIYESKEEAELNASKVRELIATAKVKWEE